MDLAESDEDVSYQPSAGRHQTAEQIPLFLRSWWLRDYEKAPDVIWHQPDCVTMPLFSLQTDPFCDAGGLDFEIQ